MPSIPFDESILAAIVPLRAAGFALHWLHPKTKRPIGEEWSQAPVADLETLRRTHAPGNNVGVRLGEPSLTGAGHLYVLDLDIRDPALADEAWEAARDLFPEVDLDSLPSVASGSGGESRHLYLVTSKPFFGRKLAVSPGKHRRTGKDGKEHWHYDWEIELFGTGKQVVLPPSIHPDTGQPYRWLREFDLGTLALGLGPVVPAEQIEALATALSETFAFETREPLTFAPGQLEGDLAALPIDRLDDYHDWVTIGQALHHQFGGAVEGFDLWVEHSRRSEKFSGDSTIRDMRGKWRGFGRNRRQPVTMGTVRQWAQDARSLRLLDQFDDLDDAPQAPAEAAAGIDIDALLGGADPDDPLAGFDTSASEVNPELEWVSLLATTADGTGWANTLHNIELIVRNDPRIAGLAQLNEFTQQTVQRVQPGRKAPRRANAAKPTRQLEGRVWRVRDPLNGDMWSDDRDNAVRAILEAPRSQGGYGIKVSDRDLKAAIALSAHDAAFHPVREYLNGLDWDGTQRVATLFIRFLGAANDAYSRSVARLMMVAAVTRIFEPGHKFDFAVILEGLQGKRKSTFIRTLGRYWFAELDGDFHDPRQMIELMHGAWILEIPELSGLSRADVRSIKAFMSRQTDRARLAYARRAGEFPRQCIFIGSTNDREYLKDDTGGRRFWPMPCQVEEIDTVGLEAEIDQLWAEAVTVYRQMRAEQPRGTLPLYLQSEALQSAQLFQETRRVETEVDAFAGQISDWLDRPIHDGGFDPEKIGASTYRSEVCLRQIWTECLGGDIKNYGRSQALMLGQAMHLVDGWERAGLKLIPGHGKQKIYVRGGSRARLNMPTLSAQPNRVAELVG